MCNKSWLLKIKWAPLRLLELVDKQISENVVQVEAAIQEETVWSVVVDRSVARSPEKWPDLTSRQEVPSVANKVILVDATIIAGEAYMAFASRAVRAALTAAWTRPAIFGTQWNWAVISSPVFVACAAVALTNSVSRTIHRARGDGKFGTKTFKNVIRIREENDCERSWLRDEFGREWFSAEAAEKDWIFRRVAIVDEYVVISAFGVHLREDQWDEVGLVFLQPCLASVRLNQPFAVRVLKISQNCIGTFELFA